MWKSRGGCCFVPEMKAGCSRRCIRKMSHHPLSCFIQGVSRLASRFRMQVRTPVELTVRAKLQSALCATGPLQTKINSHVMSMCLLLAWPRTPSLKTCSGRILHLLASVSDLLWSLLRRRQPVQTTAHLHGECHRAVQGQEAARSTTSRICHHRHGLPEYAAR